MRETRLWLLHVFAGLALVFLLTIHLFIFHLDYFLEVAGWANSRPLSFSSVLARSTGAWGWLYLVFLAIVLYHAFYGLRSILLEVPGVQPHQRALNYLIVLFGAITLAYGSYVVLSF